MHALRNRLLASAAAAGLAAVWFAAPHTAAQLPPDAALKALKPADGLEITLFASEPGLVNPTDMDIDARGRVWAVEAANYRASKARPEGDRIVIMEDTNGDGKADSYKTFFQDPSLFAPLGICVLGNKVYVAQSPNVLVFTIDESGDKAKGPPEVLFTGFTGVNHDHGVHAGVFGPDGRYYFNSGNEGTHDVIKHGDGKPVVDITGSEIGGKTTQFRGKPLAKGAVGYQEGMAFACDLDGKNFETLAYNFRNNYELTVDSFGTVWQSDNDDDGNQGVRINYVMEGGNFGYKGPKGTAWGRDESIIPGQTHQEGQWHQRWPGVVPNLLHTGGGSPTGITVYEGDLLPEKYRGALIHCDAGPNVVHAFVTRPSEYTPAGLMAGVQAAPARRGRNAAADAPPPPPPPKPEPAAPASEPAGAGYRVAEVIDFVKSADRWFRPCDVTVAPDGSVFVADWYDPGVGGHGTGDPDRAPQKDWHKMAGRIYRVAPPGSKYAPPKNDFDTVAGQIAALKNPNSAVRYVAWTKLHAGGPEAVKALEGVWSTEKNDRIRARALWLLARSEGGKKYVETALKEKNPDLRITALRAARLVKMDMPAVAGGMTGDESPQVLRELALAMNFEPADKAVPVLVKLADRFDGKDRWYLEALGIGATGKEQELLEAWTKGHTNKDPVAAEKLTWRLKMEIPTPPTAAPKQASAGEGANRPFAFAAPAAR